MPITYKILTQIESLRALEADWNLLLDRSAVNEVAMSPGWQLSWWEAFGPHEGRALRAVAFYEKARLVGLAPLLSRRHVYRPGVPFRRLELLASGEQEFEEVCSDYIGVLAERGSEPSVARVFAEALTSGAIDEWDELLMPAMSGENTMWALLAAALRERGLQTSAEVTSACPYIPLPATFDAYLEALPAARRHLVRKSLRDFEKWAGDTLLLERVKEPGELARGKEVLTSLHAQRWANEGHEGAFVSPRFQAFHDEMMRRLLESKNLDLLWVSAHGRPIAVLYNYHWQGKVHCYQTGRSLDVPKDIRPGIVMQALAIREAIGAGMREYDFLAGTQRYKIDLALASRPLLRLRAARPSLVEAARRVAELAIDEARSLRDTLAAARVKGPSPEYTHKE